MWPEPNLICRQHDVTDRTATAYYSYVRQTVAASSIAKGPLHVRWAGACSPRVARATDTVVPSYGSPNASSSQRKLLRVNGKAVHMSDLFSF